MMVIVLPHQKIQILQRYILYMIVIVIQHQAMQALSFPILDVVYDGRCSTASNKAYFTNLYVYVMVEVVLHEVMHFFH